MLSKSFCIYQLRLAILCALFCGGAAWGQEDAKKEEAAEKSAAKESPVEGGKVEAGKEAKAKEAAAKAEEDPASVKDADAVEDAEDEMAAEAIEAEVAAVARPVSPDMVQVYGWRESILIDGMQSPVIAKMDTGAYTSSIHAEEKELFERDGKKWVRFIVTEPQKKDSPRVRIEAPLVRIARIKEPGGESHTREVVQLAFKIGERKLRGEFTLNNRANMLAPVLIGRTTIRELGWIDSSRTGLADDKIMR